MLSHFTPQVLKLIHRFVSGIHPWFYILFSLYILLNWNDYTTGVQFSNNKYFVYNTRISCAICCFVQLWCFQRTKEPANKQPPTLFYFIHIILFSENVEILFLPPFLNSIQRIYFISFNIILNIKRSVCFIPSSIHPYKPFLSIPFWSIVYVYLCTFYNTQFFSIAALVVCTVYSICIYINITENRRRRRHFRCSYFTDFSLLRPTRQAQDPNIFTQLVSIVQQLSQW